MRLPSFAPLNLIKWTFSGTIALGLAFIVHQSFLVSIIIAVVVFLVLNVIINYIFERLRRRIFPLLPSAILEVEGEAVEIKYGRKIRQQRVYMEHLTNEIDGPTHKWLVDLKVVSDVTGRTITDDHVELINTSIPELNRTPTSDEVAVPATLTILGIPMQITLFKSPTKCNHKTTHWTGSIYTCRQMVRIGNSTSVALITFVGIKLETGSSKGCF